MLSKDERDEYEREDALARATDFRRGRMMTNVERECFAQISELEDVLRTAEDMVKPIVEVWKGRVALLETRIAKAAKLAELVNDLARATAAHAGCYYQDGTERADARGDALITLAERAQKALADFKAGE